MTFTLTRPDGQHPRDFFTTSAERRRMEERRRMVREMALRKAADEAKRAADAKLSDDPTRKFREIGERAQRLAVGTSSTGVTTVGNFIAGKYRSA